MISWDWWQRLPKLMSPFEWIFAIAVVCFAIWLIMWLRSYFREDTEDADATLEMLTQFHELHQEGGLSDDEFRLIRSRLSRHVQGVSTNGLIEPQRNSAKSDQSDSVDLQAKTPEKLPEQQSTMENVEKSERMTDCEAE